MYKILILVMYHKTDDETFVHLKKIWDKQVEKNYPTKNIDVYFLDSDQSIHTDYFLLDNYLISNCVENYWDSLLTKVLNGFDFFMKKNYDLVFKTNLSTIINIDKFIDVCNQLDINQPIYCGKVGKYEDYSFCSGAGMLLNKVTVSMILEKKELVSEKWTDDIFFGYILSKLNNIQPQEKDFSRYDIIFPHQIVLKDEVLNSTHIRIKVRTENKDVEYIKQVDRILYGTN